MNASNRLQRCNVRQVRGGHARLACRWVAVVGALVLSLTALGAPQAVAIEVTNINDSGGGSLRQALIDAPADDTITFASGLGQITLTSGSLEITKNLTISGPGADTLAISGNQASRVFVVREGVTATIQGVTIHGGGILNEGGTLTITNSTVRDNSANTGGGGILNARGTLTIRNSTVRDNNSPSGPGGGIFNHGGTLTVHDSIFSGNKVSDTSHTFGGGGISSIGIEDTESTLTVLNSTLTVHNSTFSNNAADNGGGGIAYSALPEGTESTLTVHNSTFSGNATAFGGGIAFGAFEGGTLTVLNSTFSGNAATFGGGGIAFEGGTGTVDNSTFSGNSAVPSSEDQNGGGGILIFAGIEGTTLTVLNSTFNGNAANTGGGIRNMGGTLTVTHSTLSGNTATEGGGISNSNNVFDDPQGGGVERIGTLTLANTILANSPSGGDCFNNDDEGSTLTPAGVNLIADGSCDASADLMHFRTGDPLLGDLAPNGGPTQTMALLVGSPAIDAAEDDSLCPDTDQRGAARPQGAKCDIGAFEQAPVTTHCRFLGDDPPPSLLDQDIFRFTGATGETVTLTLAPDPDTGQASQRATLLLTDQIAGVVFVRLDSSALPNTVQATLPAEGAYLVTVAEHLTLPPGSAFQGPYCVTLTSSADAWQSFVTTGTVEGP